MPRRRRGPLLRVLALLSRPLTIAFGRARRSPRMRRLAIRLLVVGVVLTILACSVGVILINNVVIGRTAELGRLDDRRRELRRDNALLGAQAARLSAPQKIARRARGDLGMVQAATLPTFIYLDPGSRRLTPLQKRRLALRTTRRRERAASAPAHTPAPAPAAPATEQEAAP